MGKRVVGFMAGICLGLGFVSWGRGEEVTVTWSISATAKQTTSITKSGAITGENWGLKETYPRKGGWKFVIVGGEAGLGSGTYLYRERVWVGVNIPYGITYTGIPEPTVTVDFGNTVGLTNSVIKENKTESGCSAKIWVPRKIYTISGEYVGEWLWEPQQKIFSWSVTGSEVKYLTATQTGSLSLRPGQEERKNFLLNFTNSAGFESTGVLSEIKLGAPTVNRPEITVSVESYTVTPPTISGVLLVNYPDTSPPSPVSLLSPLNGAKTNNQKPFFDWTDSTDTGSGLAGYEVRFSSPLFTWQERFIGQPITIRASGSECDGWPEMELWVDGVRVSTWLVTSDYTKGEWGNYEYFLKPEAGQREIKIVFPNDSWKPAEKKNRNLYCFI